ncbi:MAG: hypothetical protein ACKO9Q_15465, partial [Pirellula sp.]
MAEQEDQPSNSPDASTVAKTEQKQGASGPLNLEAIRRARMQQEQSKDQAAGKERDNRRKKGPSGPRPQGDSTDQSSPGESKVLSVASDAQGQPLPEKIDAEAMPERYRSNKDTVAPVAAKVPVPSSRRRDQQEDSELEAALDGADLENLMIGDKNVGRVGVALEIGNRYQARVIKVHHANVFVSLGGPNEGVVPLLQFLDMPTEGLLLDVVIRSFNAEEGL